MKIKLKDDYVKIATELGFDEFPNKNIFNDFNGKELIVHTTWEADGITMYTIDLAVDVPADGVIVLTD